MSTAANTTIEIYTQSMEHKIAQLHSDLRDLTQILASRDFTRHEYHSAERLLQVLVESCIGLSKQWIKLLDKTVPTDAYQAIHLLNSYGYINNDEELNWRKIIGLRNALVHDYLNIEPEIIKKIINESFYNTLIQFADNAINAILNLSQKG